MKPSGIEWIGKIPEDLQDKDIPCVSYGEIHSKYGFEVNPEKHLLREE